MTVVTASQMRDIDRYCIEMLKIPGIVLMENAALKVVKHIDVENNHYFTVICGSGNNGGDGLAVARHLFAMNKNVEVFLIGSIDKMSECCRINYDILKNMGVNICTVHNMENVETLINSISKSHVTIDALFGTGLSSNVKGIYYDVIYIMNKHSSYIISIDIPSGLYCDSGKPLNISVKANETVTFQLNKKGFLNPEANKYTGVVKIEPIGIPSFVISKFV